MSARTLDEMLSAAVRVGASDLHLTVDLPPMVRIQGELRPLAGFETAISNDWILTNLIDAMLPDARRDVLARGEVDVSYSPQGIGRFRINIFRERGRYAAALRLIPERILSLAELGLPPVARSLAVKPRGLVLVTGPAGSGKSTTLAAMVDVINDTTPAHIITIEDPIEYVHHSRTALVHQREVGSDTASFHEALRRSLRQDPDVLLIGELRDMESMEAAVQAAETGQLVLATLHTQGAAKTINRLVGAFPDAGRHQVRNQLGDTLLGVISQTLVPRSPEPGRIVATEVLINTPAIANMIREGEVAQLYSAMQAGSAMGMHTLDQDLKRLIEDGLISKEVATHYGVHPETFDDVNVRDLSKSSATWQSDNGEANEGWR